MAGRKGVRNAGKADAGASPQQFAALPFRDIEGLQVMLVTSRETRRWVLPKGWPIKGLRPPSVAKREAMEEAGLTGKVAKEPFGTYHYVKRMGKGVSKALEVGVFPMAVEKQRRDWPERLQRTTSWFAPEDAADLVDEPELRDLILCFASSHRKA
ncbi:MAG: NUDIX hydrolase [Rhodoblastus sp.]